MSNRLFYPVSLDIAGKKCLVIGGGGVAFRKVKSLIACGGRVSVASPALSPPLKRLVNKKKAVFINSGYNKKLLKGIFLVIAASSERKVNSRAAFDATRLGILSNVVDSAAESNFILPAVLRRGKLAVAVSTSGASPFLAKALRDKLKKYLGKEYAGFLDLCAYARRNIAGGTAQKNKKQLYAKIINSRALHLLKKGKAAEARKIVLAAVKK